MLQWLAERGIPKSPHQTPQEYVFQIVNETDSPLNSAQTSIVKDITQTYQDWRYGDRSTNPANLKFLLAKLRRRRKN